jgi:3-oxoacyl-[acyl-carrier protein] reductase/meso-butanediol dehydrogenase/(S,S)-butanediol dehydrogenase/diacetyl reductase
LNKDSSTLTASSLARRFEGQVALITGGGTGIGAAIARQLAAEGAKVALVGRRTALVNAAAQRLRDGGHEALAVPGNVATDAQRIVETVVQHFGALDVLVNNAAVAAGLDMDEMTVDAWRQVLEVNLDGAFALVLHAQPHLASRRGCVLHISSISAVSGEFDDVAYATSKAAIEGFSRRLAIELAPRGVRSNVIRPGLIRTEAFAELPEDFFASQLPMIPLHRFGAPEDIAKAAAFLCSGDAGFITGAVLTIDGGESAR